MTSIPSVVAGQHVTQLQTQPRWSYYWQDNAVYVSADDGQTWRLFMYFPER